MARWLRFLPALLWAGLIFVASSRSRLPLAELGELGVDKLLHATAYALLALALLYGSGWRRRHAWVWAAVAALYGVSDEWHQAWVPGRHPDIWDAWADAAGAGLAVASWLRWTTVRSQGDR